MDNKEQEQESEGSLQDLEQEQEQERNHVLSCLRSQGFQVLQAQWSLLVKAYRRDLEDVRKSPEELRVLQGRLCAFSDIKAILESYLERKEEVIKHE